MADTARMFLCARCRVQVLICRRCDRGQIYCDRLCAAQARGAAQRAAGQRYQTSRAGRFAHAARARLYRQRYKIVTHQGSASAPADALLPVRAAKPAGGCHRCGAQCAPAVRLGFLRRRRTHPRLTMSFDDHIP
jgi:hypothetical protein